jgi:FkbM family methyltransferase
MTMLRKVHRGILYLQRGSFLDRLKVEKRRYQNRVTRFIRFRKGLWWDSQVGKREYVEKEISSGVKIRLYLDSQLSRMIFVGGFEENEKQFLTRFLKSGDIFVDIGSNIGFYSLLAANIVGGRGQVYAFEPAPRTFKRLDENIRLNKFENVQLFQLGVSSACDLLTMMVSMNGFDAWNSFGQPIKGESFTTEQVDVIKWDDFVSEHSLMGKVKMIKIDVEGWETNVLLGGQGMFSLANAPVLQIELNGQALKRAGSSCQELMTLIQNFGYCIYRFLAPKREFAEYFEADDHTDLNVYAIKNLEDVMMQISNVSL